MHRWLKPFTSRFAAAVWRRALIIGIALSAAAVHAAPQNGCDDLVDKWIRNQADNEKLNLAFDHLPLDEASIGGAQRIFKEALEADVAALQDELLIRLPDLQTRVRLLQRVNTLDNPQVSKGIALMARHADGGFAASKIAKGSPEAVLMPEHLQDFLPPVNVDDAMFIAAEKHGLILLRTNPGAGVTEASSLFTTSEGLKSSISGLIYRKDNTYGNRINHIMNHARDWPSRGAPHGVFFASPEDILKLLDEAIAKRPGADFAIWAQDPSVAHVRFDHDIGVQKGLPSDPNYGMSTPYLRFVFSGRASTSNLVVTAFPVVLTSFPPP